MGSSGTAEGERLIEIAPDFEQTALFERGIGEATDVVGKEMYTFSDRGDRSITLRPEGTAVVRSPLNKVPNPRRSAAPVVHRATVSTNVHRQGGSGFTSWEWRC